MSSGMTFAFLIISVVLLARVLQKWIEVRHSKPEIDDDVQDTLDRIDSLEERIRVLERIITENHYDLKREIDSL